MGTRYTSNSISGYNSTPPPDDGTQSEANKVKWSTIKNKLTDPPKVLAEAIDTDIGTALDYGPVSVVSTSTTLGAAQNAQFIDISGASTPTLGDASTLAAGWWADVKNTGSSVITMARTTSTDTINTVTADVTMNPLDYIRFVVNAAASGFVTVGTSPAASQSEVDAGTVSDAYVNPETLKAWVVNTLASTQTDTDAGLKSDVCVTPETLTGRPGMSIQVVNALDGEYQSASTTMPIDDSIPQNTEGVEVMTLSLTPTKTTNKLLIEVVIVGSTASADWLSVALFQDSTADAIASTFHYFGAGSQGAPLHFSHYMTADTASSTTFKVRVGANTVSADFNGRAGGRMHGGVLASSITITEIAG